MLLYDMTGNCGGNWGDEPAPDGYWLRDYDRPTAMTAMTALEFLDKLGADRFNAVWGASLVNTSLAFPMARGLAAQSIEMSQSFPALYALEQAGLLPSGTAIEVWS